MRKAFVRSGVVLALFMGTTVVGVNSASATSPGVSVVTCNEGWWKWEGTSGQLRRFLPNHDPTGWNCFLAKGDYDNWGVVALQNMLRRCYHQMIDIDGDFGPLTEAALRNAQRWARDVEGKDVAVNGVYGPQSRDELQWPYYEVQDIFAPSFCSHN